MKKYPRILFPILTLLLLAVSLTGCAAENGSGSGTSASGSSASGSGNSASGSGTGGSGEEDPDTKLEIESDEAMSPITFDALPDAFVIAGKTIAELGYTEEDLGGSLYLVLDCGFLGKRQIVNAYTESWNDYRISELSFTAKRPMAAAEEYFTELYGEPYETGEEPYAASNGGVVYWSDYWTGEGIIHLSAGEESDFYSFSYRPAEKPAKILNSKPAPRTDYSAGSSAADP